MADWEQIFAELKEIRQRLDVMAAAVTGRQQAEELLPVWSCGHRHRSRREAVLCLKREHTADLSCWCCPQEVEPGVVVDNDEPAGNA